MNDKEFVVFYAWQSDSPSKTNRNFIENALKDALKKLKQEGKIDFSPRLDKDTLGVPGSPDIANTILEKINSADAFLADVSMVGNIPKTNPSEIERMPNPNVMIELGYALAKLGPERIILVMNTATGSKDDMPFDLRNRKLSGVYELLEDSPPSIIKEQKASLSNQLQKAIEDIAKLPEEQKHKIQYQKLLKSFIDRVKNDDFNNFSYKGGFIVLTICPTSKQESLSLFETKKEHLLGKLCPLGVGGWDHRRYGNSFITFSERNNEIVAVTEITEEGFINAAGHDIIGKRGHADNDILYIPSISYEKDIIEAIGSYINTLKELGVNGPWKIGLGLIDIKNSILSVGADREDESRIFQKDQIIPPGIEIPNGIDLNDFQNIARPMRKIFDYIWREYNFPKSLNYSKSGDWVGR